MSADEYQWYIGYIKQELEKGFVIEHSHWVSEKTNTQWVHPSSEDIQIAEKEHALHCKVEGEWNLCDLQNIMETMENAKMSFFIILVWNNIRKTGTHLILNMWPFLTKLTPTPILRKFRSFPFFLWDNDEDEIYSLQIFKTLKIMQKIVISKFLTSEVKKKNNARRSFKPIIYIREHASSWTGGEWEGNPHPQSQACMNLKCLQSILGNG